MLVAVNVVNGLIFHIVLSRMKGETQLLHLVAVVVQPSLVDNKGF